MKDFVVVIWDYKSSRRAPEALAMLERCGLRDVAKQEAGSVYDEAFGEFLDTGASGSVKLVHDDPRLDLLLKELRKAKVEPSTRRERKYDKAEIDAAPWLWVTVNTSLITAGRQKGQKWDLQRACKRCGAGAVPIPPLITKFEQPSKSGWSVSAPCGLVISSADVAYALVESKLTGFEVLPVRTPSRKTPDGRFRWLRVTSVWPAYARATVLDRNDACPTCDRTGRFQCTDRVPELHYDTVPGHAQDFNQTLEQSGSSLSDDGPDRQVGAAPGLILSQRARRVLREAGAKVVGLEPVFIAGRIGPAPATSRAKTNRRHRR